MPEKITLPLFADFQNRKLVTEDGSSFTPPTLTLGDTLLCPLTIMDRAGSDLVAKDYAIRSVRAALGPTIAAPTAGGWDLELEDPDHDGQYWQITNPLALSPAIADLGAALTALFANVGVAISNLSAAGEDGALCWTFSTDGAQSFNLRGGVRNSLHPVSFVRVNPYQEGNKWWYEIRLIQAPLAFNPAGFDRILPDPPMVTRIRSGAAETESSPAVNELQDLYVPPDFRGTYFFRWNFRRSNNLGYDQGPDVAATVLDGMYSDNAVRFDVTSPESNHGQIEFVGDLAGAPQPLITVEVYDHPPGVVTFEIPLDRAELATALRNVASLNTVLEIEIEVVDDPADLDNLAVAGRTITLCQLVVTVVRAGIWKGLDVVRQIDFQRPISPRTYLPFNPSQLIPGQQHYVALIGDGESTEIEAAHGLGTKQLAGIFAAEDSAGGRILTLNQDLGAFYSQDDPENAIVFRFAQPPALNSIFVCITTAGPVSTFINDLHIAVAQVDQLNDLLDAYAARLNQLEQLAGVGALSTSTSTSSSSRQLIIPDAFFLFPDSRIRDVDPSTFGTATKALLDSLPLPPDLFAAVHSTTISTFNTASLPASPTVGTIYKNAGTNPVIVPGSGGRRESIVPVGETVAWDGRGWARVARAGDTNTYFVRDFERPLTKELYFSNSTWKPGQAFTFEFDLELQLLLANTIAQCVLVIEHGTLNPQFVPSPTASNLDRILWHQVPLSSQPLVLSGLKQSFHFGCQIKRSSTNQITAKKLIQDAYSGADSAPLSEQFVLRARLIYFDVTDQVANPVGYIYAALTGAQASIG